MRSSSEPPRRVAARTAALFLLAGIAASGAPNARAVVIAGRDGTANASAPADDPGWANVGTHEKRSVVYLGDRWVLTASHVGFGEVVLAGRTYEPVPRSLVRLRSADGALADLILYRLVEDPGLPAIEILRQPLHVGQQVLMIGNGRQRAEAYADPASGFRGWSTILPNVMRWGTNRVVSVSQRAMNTHAGALLFDEPGTGGADESEAQVTEGDSGGAVFVHTPNGWRLAGILIAASWQPNQARFSVIFSNASIFALLSEYQEQIAEITGPRGAQPTVR